MKNKKGFTLIEILAAVTILGVLSIVAVVSVNKIIQKSKMNHYTTAEDNLEMAGQSYVQQNRSILPKVIGQKVKIPLKTLVNKNYIEPIKDYSDNECDMDNSYVQIFKYSRNDYSYLAFLDCPVYDSKEQIENGKPQISIILTNPLSTKSAKAQIKINDSEKLLSWSYIIYKNGKEVLNSGNIMLPNYDKSIEKVLNISKFTPGKIKVIATATNIYGLTTNEVSEVIEYKDTSGPNCIINEEDKKENSKPWTKEYRTITVGCDDGEGSGCTREEYTKTFKKTTDIGEIVIEDESGNKTVCEVSVNVDRTKPTCTVNLTGTKGDGGWYKTKNVDVMIVSSDMHSGVGSYDLTTSETPSYNNVSKNIQSDTAGITWYGYVKDNVGNVGQCNATLKVDTVKPTCTVTKTGVVGDNGWYKSNAVKLDLTSSDNLSGVVKTGLSTDSNPTLGSTTSATQSDIGSVVWYGKVRDAAGNVSVVCSSGEFKVDTQKPQCSVSFSGTSGNNGWYKSNVNVSLTKSDGLSGVESFGLSTSSSVTYNSSASSSQSDVASQSWYGYAKDYAGNTISCNNTVKVDTQKPSCTISLSGTSGNNGWYKSNVSVTLNSSDSGPSGVSKTGLGTSSSPTLGNKTSASQGNTTGVTYYGRVQDAAGHISDTCSSSSFKVDSSSPSCTISVSTSGIKINSSDSGSSGVSSSSINGGGTSATLGAGTFNGSVTDKAGNSGSCSKKVVAKSSSPHCGSYSTDSSGTCYYTNSDFYSVGSSTCVCSNPGLGVTPAVWTHDGIPYPATSSASCAGLCYGKGYGSSSYTPGKASCSKGSVSGSTCKITVTTPQGYNYYCESGYTEVGSYCYK